MSVSFEDFVLCSLCVYILNVLPLLKISFYMSASEWLRISNKCGFRMANRFAQRKSIIKLEPMDL